MWLQVRASARLGPSTRAAGRKGNGGLPCSRPASVRLGRRGDRAPRYPAHRAPFQPTCLWRIRLEAVRRQAAADGPAIDPWHLAAVIEGVRFRIDRGVAIIDRGSILRPPAMRSGFAAGSPNPMWPSRRRSGAPLRCRLPSGLRRCSAARVDTSSLPAANRRQGAQRQTPREMEP